jgi:hypothetical protein
VKSKALNPAISNTDVYKNKFHMVLMLFGLHFCHLLLKEFNITTDLLFRK